VRAAVLAATVEALLDDGLASLSVADVAERAGVHQTSIYRRWGTKDNLVVDALLSRVGTEAPIPDTGSLEGDLRAFVTESAAFMATPLGAALARVAVAMGDSPDLAEIRHDYWSRALSNAGRMFERAAKRGEIARKLDPQVAVEAVAGPLYMRMLLTGEPLDEEFLTSVVDTILHGTRDR
jgi:AcrR family transcriptional regulator